MDLEKFHLVTRLAYQAAHYKDREAIRYWEEGQWRPMSWTVFYDKIQELAKALLHHKVGGKSGDFCSQLSPMDYGGHGSSTSKSLCSTYLCYQYG